MARRNQPSSPPAQHLLFLLLLVAEFVYDRIEFVYRTGNSSSQSGGVITHLRDTPDELMEDHGNLAAETLRALQQLLAILLELLLVLLANIFGQLTTELLADLFVIVHTDRGARGWCMRRMRRVLLRSGLL